MTFPDLTRSIRNWTPAERRRAAALTSVAGLAITIWIAIKVDSIFYQADTPQYLALAAGQPAMLPFASRQLGPLIVRWLVAFFQISIHQAFFVEGTLALLVFFFAVLWFLLRSRTPRFMITAVFGLYFWARTFNGLVVPDLLYAALLCIFLFFLLRQRFYLAALMMFPLFVCRESTLLTLACLLIAGYRRLRLPEAAVALASTFAGMVVVRHLSANSLPNSEHISPTLYLFAKMPWAFLKNILGILPWSNVYPSCLVPRWQMNLHFGPVQAIGICGFAPAFPLEYLFYGLASFGLFPLLFLAVRRQAVRRAAALANTGRSRRAGLFLRFCIVYGLISFILAGVLGESFQRLFAYSWPIFLLALPILLATSRLTFSSNPAALAFLAIHLVLSWLAINFYQPKLIPAEIALWIAGWFLLRKTLRTPPENASAVL